MNRKEALQKGLKKYFTGRQCSRGHIADRYAKTGHCTVCARQTANTWRERERDSYNEYHREYSGRSLRLIEKYLRDPNEIWFEKRTRQRAALKQATPPWADPWAIRRVYEECVRLSRIYNMEFEVGHEVPLKGRKVCGLHVAGNLKVVSKSYRRGTGNRFNQKRESKELGEWLKQLGL